MSFIYCPLTHGCILWCLMPLSTIFQLYHGGSFYWWRKPEYPKKTINLSHTLSHNVVSSTPHHERQRTFSKNHFKQNTIFAKQLYRTKYIKIKDNDSNFAVFQTKVCMLCDCICGFNVDVWSGSVHAVWRSK